MAIQNIRKHLDNILHFMEPYWEFVNCHMVNYLTDSYWEKYIPIDIKNSIKCEDDIDLAIKQIFCYKDKHKDFAALFNFIQKFHQFRLDNINDVLHTKNEFYEILKIKDKNDSQLSIKEFMSEKKRHEVEITTELVANLMKSTGLVDYQNFIVIDAGDGKGYLSSRLALEYDIKVIGIDSNVINTEGAQDRNNKLQKAWNGLTERAKILNKGEIPPRRGKKTQKSDAEFKQLEKAQNYKTINKFITPELELQAILKEELGLVINSNTNICLTGLHTCGNLSSTCLKAFKEQNIIKHLCNIGCCYHLINEKFIKDDFFVNKKISDENIDYGFPLSQYLTESNIKMGRNARMLAAQSIHRTLENKNLSGKSLFYRALLEIIIVNKFPKYHNSKQVGKIKKFNNFQEYVEICKKKINIDLNDCEIENLEKLYSKDEKLLNLFYLIRMNFAPILETIILLDRLLYLKENGFEKSYIVKMFDPIVSPRCFGIVAIK